MEVCKLIRPLSQDSKRILEEGDDDQEAAYRWEISAFVSFWILKIARPPRSSFAVA